MVGARDVGKHGPVYRQHVMCANILRCRFSPIQWRVSFAMALVAVCKAPSVGSLHLWPRPRVSRTRISPSSVSVLVVGAGSLTAIGIAWLATGAAMVTTSSKGSAPAGAVGVGVRPRFLG